VTNVWSTTPAQHYSCSRFKLTFSLSGTDSAGKGVLACALITVEASLPATFYNSQVLWVPTAVAQIWDYVPQVDSAHQAAALAAYPNQDAPIAVYYDGDTEMVVRFKYTTHSSVEDTYTPIPSDYATTSTPYGYFNSYTADGTPTGFRFTGDTFHHVYQAGITTGFTVPGYNGIAEGRSYSTFDDHMTATPFTTYQDVTETGACVTDWHKTLVWFYEYQVRTHRVGTRVQHGAMALQLNEREGVLGVKDAQLSDTVNKDWADYNVNYLTIWEISGRNSCNKTGLVAGLAPVNSLPPFSGTTFYSAADNSYSADATLMLGGVANTVSAISNSQLSAFLITGLLVGAHPVVSGVSGMHGNLYAADPKLTPPDQKANGAIWLQSGAVGLSGGFAATAVRDPTKVIAFIGKA